MARKKSSRAKVRSATKNSRNRKSEEKWVTRTSYSEPTSADKPFAPVRASVAGNVASDAGRFVSRNKLLVAGAAVVAAAIAFAPAVANAASTTVTPTPEQQAQAAADARAEQDRSTGIKIAAGGFALIAAATVVYAATSEDAPRHSPQFRPATLY